MTDKKTTTDQVDHAKVDGKAGGTAAGGTAGAIIGGVVGGPVGAGIGAVVGSALGGVAGALIDDRAYHEVAPEFRHEWERGPYKESTTWDEASSAYQYGWDSHTHPEYQGRTWDEVGPRLGQTWSGPGSWGDWEPLARTAWERRASGKHVETYIV